MALKLEDSLNEMATLLLQGKIPEEYEQCAAALIEGQLVAIRALNAIIEKETETA